MGVSDITSVNIIECYVLSGKPYFNKQLIANISPTKAKVSPPRGTIVDAWTEEGRPHHHHLLPPSPGQPAQNDD